MLQWYNVNKYGVQFSFMDNGTRMKVCHGNKEISIYGHILNQPDLEKLGLYNITHNELLDLQYSINIQHQRNMNDWVNIDTVFDNSISDKKHSNLEYKSDDDLCESY
jgi:hypothetical protein